MFFFFFVVNFSNDLLIPVPIVPTTEVYEAIRNIPNDADRVINILSK